MNTPFAYTSHCCRARRHLLVLCAPALPALPGLASPWATSAISGPLFSQVGGLTLLSGHAALFAAASVAVLLALFLNAS